MFMLTFMQRYIVYVPALGDFRKYLYPVTNNAAYKSVPVGVWRSIWKQETGVFFACNKMVKKIAFDIQRVIY